MIKLNNRIKFKKIEYKQSDYGTDIPELSKDTYYSCWAEFKTVSGKEFIAAKTTNSENIVTFTVRYCNKLKPLLNLKEKKNFKIEFNDCTYNILFASDRMNLHKYIDIKCEVIT
ncbi:phage head closure protein [Clostridium perfringens]|uniref:phage head closure protein n=1 Tax=Clostridium perfringens TaxID=1502 RepID=UPI0013E3A343|nr:phage head closure protein [Clostridium perfringens]MDM0720359.1 phage head closure protein [Clostridium perfringens]MDM0723425.1 phage head closure protein [Clostridium perfringens]QPS27012.1 phage head closure protein [Clostridium perfringens]UBK42118.1 phage head closure protein [Clostridium perfringens]HAT4314967.1 phage head closure protein [Clostridium perfringens]